jgi:hypothetical protein
VFERAVRIAEEHGTLFIGDVRSLELQAWLHTAVEIHRAGSEMTVRQLKDRIGVRAAQDRELTFSPSFFEALPARYPAVASVSCELKRGRHHNELTRFRFDVTVALGRGTGPELHASVHRWEDFGNLDALSAVVASAREPVVVTGIPNARLSVEAAVMRALEAASLEDSIEPLKALANQPATGVEPEDVWERGADLGVRTSLRQSDSAEKMDALFTPVSCSGRAFIHGWHRHLSAGEGFDLRAHASMPLAGRPRTRIIAGIRAHLSQRLPDYMVPSSIVVLNALPMTANGKVDVRALPDANRDRLTPAGFVAPRTALERRITGIWKSLLGTDSVGVHDNFFDLGGHSLLVIHLHKQLRSQLNVDCTVLDVFRCPTVSAQAGLAMQTLAFAPAGAQP